MYIMMVPFAEAFRSLLELEGVSEEGLDAWMEGLPHKISNLRLTQLIHALTLLLLGATQGTKVGRITCACLRCISVAYFSAEDTLGKGRGAG